MKSGFWYASADGKETPLPAHMRWGKMSRLDRAWKISTLQRPARRERERETDSPSAHYFHLHTFALIGSSLGGGCEQVDLLLPANLCHLYRSRQAGKRRPAGRLVWSLFTWAGLGSKTYPSRKITGLRSDRDEWNWHQNHEADERRTNTARLMEQSVKMSPFYNGFVVLS